MKIELLETAGWYTVFKNLRQSYSLDSRSELNNDTNFKESDDIEYFGHTVDYGGYCIINNKDLQLLSTLVKKGDSHSKIIRGIQTYVEITAPRYWWQEWLTYVIGVLEINPTIDWVSLNSESTMYTLKKQVELPEDYFISGTTYSTIDILKDKINKSDSLQSIKANLPEGYLQTRTFQVSYQAWRRIYQQRHNHKLEEWSKDIVKFIKDLPFSKELITVEK